MYYQFVLKIEGYLPMTMRKKYRSYDRAMKSLDKYVKEGIQGCLVTLMNGALIEKKEF